MTVAEGVTVYGNPEGRGRNRLLVEVGPRRFLTRVNGGFWHLPLPYTYYILARHAHAYGGSSDYLYGLAMTAAPDPLPHTKRVYAIPLPTLYSTGVGLGSTCAVRRDLRGDESFSHVVSIGVAAFWESRFTYWAGGNHTALWRWLVRKAPALGRNPYSFWELNDIDDVMAWPWQDQPSAGIHQWATIFGVTL